MGVVSVVVVNFRGAADTITCVRALRTDLAWPQDRLEIIVVDNASGDGSLAEISRSLPGIKLVESPDNAGFAGGCNAGAARAKGEFLAFLNNDARPDSGWLRSAVAGLEVEPRVACVASKVLDWEGRTVDYVDSSLTWFGWGYKREVGRPDNAVYNEARDVLFASGAAMVVRADVFRDVGGFDERFFMFFEDVDFGWRLNLLGHRVRYVPESLVFHKHHASVSRFGAYRESYLLERNALLAMYKNYEDETLVRVLPAAMALSVRRSIARGAADPDVLDLQRTPEGDAEERIEVSKEALAGPLAVDFLARHIGELHEERQRIQAARRRGDRELAPLFRQAMEPAVGVPSYLTAYADVVRAFEIEELFRGRRRVAIVTGEPLKPAMAGPAIRAWEMAKALSVENDIRFVTLSPVCDLTDKRFETMSASTRKLREIERWCDVLVFQGMLLEHQPWLRDSRKVLVADIYDPFHLEALEQLREHSEAVRSHAVANNTRALNVQLGRGDFFLCASGKQRDFWLGQLAGVGRVNPATYEQDETLASLIATVPFGIPDEAPVHTRQVLKGIVPGIGQDDKVILWGGGVYNWFDPLTLVRAVDRLRARHPDARLFFMGMKHPNPEVPEMRVAFETRQLASSLGLTGKVVFFNETWVPYTERQNYLLESDVGVSTHLDHVETAFSFRTRILDYLWAGLPVVATAGDALGELIDKERMGATVAAGDVEALEQALEQMLYNDTRARAARDNVARVAPSMTWSEVVGPLVEFCREPMRAPDLVARLGPSESRAHAFVANRQSLRDDWVKMRMLYSEGGAGHLARKITGRVRQVVDQCRSGSRK